MFSFSSEIHGGHQKWQENEFWPKVAVDSVNTLWVKHFVDITLSRTVSKILKIFHFPCQKRIVTFCYSLISWPFFS